MTSGIFSKNRLEGVFYFLYNLGKLAKRGGGGYPQALPKVINLQGMLELPEILVLIVKPPPHSYNIYCEKRRRIQKENRKSECLTVTQLSALVS